MNTDPKNGERGGKVHNNTTQQGASRTARRMGAKVQSRVDTQRATRAAARRK